jgi:hypothetical protein
MPGAFGPTLLKFLLDRVADHGLGDQFGRLSFEFVETKRTWLSRSISLGAALVLLTACSTARRSTPPVQSSRPPTIGCTDQLRAAFSSASRSKPILVRADVAVDYTKCDYRLAAGTSGCPIASVTINTEPHAFADFNRWVVETVQNAGGVAGAGLAPHEVDGIGVLADWVPDKLTFETATETRWIAVYLTCPSAGPRDLSLAEALARAALNAH